MTPSELNQATAAAKEACISLIAHPNDRSLHARLFSVLEPITRLSYAGRQDGYSAALYGIIRQVGVLSEFLHNRIDVTLRKATVTTSEISAIKNNANDLRHKLDEMLGLLDGKHK